MQKNILITGKPRSGKTTFLSALISGLQNKVGFVTHEILVDGKRVGFEVEDQNGRRAILAHIDFPTTHKVARYFVHPENISQILPDVRQFNENDYLYLDEIGEMQLLSEDFKSLALAYLGSENICVATISNISDDEFTSSLKKRDDVILIEIDVANRDSQMLFATQLLKKIEKARQYIAELSRFVRTDSQVTLQSEHGVRILSVKGGIWNCSCDFFAEHGICSHSIATKEIVKSLSLSAE
jgi:nucleoside-triphosphatase